MFNSEPLFRSIAAMLQYWEQPIARWTALISVPLVLYPLICLYWRFERVQRIQKQMGYMTRASFAKMTNEDAYNIILSLSKKEFPRIFALSIQFALFKTYGIPTISKLLVATGQLSNEKTVSKRAADTSALIFEFSFNEPTSERNIAAIARMNFLHSGYKKAGKISNDDLLYTLSLFALEPKRFIAKYEWRSLTPLEICALGSFWKRVGVAMKISFESFPSKEWKDGVHWMEELEQWSLKYEERCMVPAATSHKVSECTVSVVLAKVPKPLRGVGQKVVSALLEERLRKAIIFEKPPPIYYTLVSAVMETRKFILRCLTLPRVFPKAWDPIINPKTCGHWLQVYAAHPWYVKPTWYKRWGPGALYNKFVGIPLPGDDAKYFPDGFITEEVGPENFIGKGMADMYKDRIQLCAIKKGSCPFH